MNTVNIFSRILWQHITVTLTQFSFREKNVQKLLKKQTNFESNFLEQQFLNLAFCFSTNQVCIWRGSLGFVHFIESLCLLPAHMDSRDKSKSNPLKSFFFFLPLAPFSSSQVGVNDVPCCVTDTRLFLHLNPKFINMTNDILHQNQKTLSPIVLL